jgi:hypothetical protein
VALWIRKKWHKALFEPDHLHPTTVENRSSSRWATYNTTSTVGRWRHPGPQSSNKDGDIEEYQKEEKLNGCIVTKLLTLSNTCNTSYL